MKGRWLHEIFRSEGPQTVVQVDGIQANLSCPVGEALLWEGWRNIFVADSLLSSHDHKLCIFSGCTLNECVVDVEGTNVVHLIADLHPNALPLADAVDVFVPQELLCNGNVAKASGYSEFLDEHWRQDVANDVGQWTV